MVNEIFQDMKDRMTKAVDHYRSEVATIRTGRASVNILDPIKINAVMKHIKGMEIYVGKLLFFSNEDSRARC